MSLTRALIASAMGGLFGLICTVVAKATLPQFFGKGPHTRNFDAQQVVLIVPALAMAFIFIWLGWDAALAELLLPAQGASSMAERAMRPMFDDPLFAQAIRGKSADEVSAITRDLGAKGLRRLSTQELLRVGEIRKQLAVSSPAFCAQLWSGPVLASTVFAALEKLPPDDAREFFRLSAKSVRLELHGEGEPIGAADASETLAAVETALGDRAEEFRGIAELGAKASPGDGCKAILLIFDAIPKLPERHARLALSLFVQ